MQAQQKKDQSFFLSTLFLPPDKIGIVYIVSNPYTMGEYWRCEKAELIRKKKMVCFLR